MEPIPVAGLRVCCLVRTAPPPAGTTGHWRLEKVHARHLPEFGPEHPEFYFNESAGISWPIPPLQPDIPVQGRTHRAGFGDGRASRTLVVGANGQLGRALRARYLGDPDVDFLTRTELDLAAPEPFLGVDFSRYATVINAAAYTSVDAAETPAGRAAAWAVNATAVGALARACTEHRMTLVQLSSDHVFDGTVEIHDEDEPVSPLGVYGQSQAAGDIAAATTPRHYILRTSRLTGDGSNFVTSMASLARRGVRPTVVNDEYGRLTFAEDLAAAIAHLLGTGARYGVYNMSNSGPVQSWAEVAADVFAILGLPRDSVTGVPAADYYADRPGSAPRPAHSALNLAKLKASGFTPPPARERLEGFLGGRSASP
ncbi:NAD(P)-dependent oxidoreductase [Arthrobacter sp. STN4]|uniref:SDR family oxidoreductase n=1 Tax=Arthrobacter sp. STN4 TaxID=2923276 RepID=UPI002119E764|nr:NAD(P)-dependent oxidoreductase [Arthrobacter sp. STN4]MCQ9163653.1 NAD(P)-dependent oxidoreductase [Arthrobacter sp. STN4]